MIGFFQSPNICRDIKNTKEFRALSATIRDDFGHKITEAKKSLNEQNKTLSSFRLSPVYKAMLSIFCSDVLDNNKIYGLPITEDKEVSCIQYEFKEKEGIE